MPELLWAWGGGYAGTIVDLGGRYAETGGVCRNFWGLWGGYAGTFLGLGGGMPEVLCA